MSDLISRKEVIDILCKLHIDNIAVNDKRVTEYIRELPTAYDVEKVVAQLEEKINIVNDQVDRDSTWGILGVRAGYKEAIEIVRYGGKE